MNPYSKDKLTRPRFPEVVKEVLEEEKERENEGIWREVVRRDEELKKKVKEKEDKIMKEEMGLSDSLFSDKDKEMKSIDDII